MIEVVEIKTCSTCWKIDGIIICLRRSKCISDELTGQMIERYRNLLLNEIYRINPEILVEIADVLGDTCLVRIGTLVYPESFLRMFKYYAVIYVVKWEHAGECIITNKASIFPVFNLMFQNEIVKKAESKIHILRDVPCVNKRCLDIFEEKFSELWMSRIEEKVKAAKPLTDIEERIGVLCTTKYFCRLPKAVIADYLNAFAAGFTEDRVVISAQGFYRKIIGNTYGLSGFNFHPDFTDLADETVHREFNIQYKKFIEENHLQLDTAQDKWILFYRNGPLLMRQIMDFTKIHSTSLRMEIKYFMKYRYFNLSECKDQAIYVLPDAVNQLSQNNKNIHFFADVDDVDVRSLYMSMERQHERDSDKSAVKIMRTFYLLSALVEHLMSARRDNSMRSPIPHENLFARYKFHNARDYYARTPIIPEDIAEQIDTHLDEIAPIYALLYRIFSQTGMRAKEVLFLEAGCLSKSRFDGLVQIRYKQYKTLVARRKAGVHDYHSVLVTQSLADEITMHIQAIEPTREELGLPYIFVTKNRKCRACMLSVPNYLRTINRLIEKYDLLDENGVLWHLTSKQQRKTLAVTLIENGASVEELAYWLGHLSSTTAAGYYAEVRKMKLAELNTAFYREKFSLLLSDEQLVEYNEEERRLLYMDFRLEQRRVELGFCLKKLADGGCSNRNSLYNCVNCKNLCTGYKYLPYWQDLLRNQHDAVDGLRSGYANSGIADFKGFKEYKQAVFLFSCYEKIVKAIESEVQA